MKAWTKFCSVLAVTTLVVAGVLASAQPEQESGPGFGMRRPPMERLLGPEGARGRWWNNPKVVDELKLTDDQRKSMDDILQQHAATLIDMRSNVQKAELAMQPLLGEDQPNESAILSQIDKVAQARADLEKANARFLLALRARLTPEQWKALQTMRAERHQQRMDRGNWRNRGPQETPPQGGQPGEPQGAPGNPPQGPEPPQSMLDEGPGLK